MTDKQLAFTLRLILVSLQSEISIASGQLAEGLAVRETKNFIMKDAVTISYPALDGLVELANEIKESIDSLESNVK